MDAFFRRLRNLFQPSHMDDELREELEFHRALTQERLERSGVPRVEAEARSRRAMGNMTLAREDARATWVRPWIDGLRQDTLYAFRQLVRQPLFALLAIATLATAIGLNTTLFTVFNALAIKPWAVPEPERVVNLFNMSSRDLRARGGGAPRGFSLAEAEYFRANAKAIRDVIAMRSGGGDQTLDEADVPASWVSGNYFSVLGVQMTAGRGFSSDEDRTDTPAAVAVISHAYWRRQFGGDPSIVGRQIRFEDVPFTIVGIAGPTFTGTKTDRVDVWLPIASAPFLRPDDRWVRSIAQRPENCCVALAARLRDGVTRNQAQAELVLLDRQFRADRKTTSPEDNVVLTGTELSANPKGDPTSSFVPMFAGVLLVLLLACANVGNLLIARAVARRREIAVRLSLGAGRTRVVRQLLTEGMVLAGVAGLTGLWIASWLPAVLVSQTMGNAALQLTPDRTVLWFTAALSLLSCVAFALAPALHGTRIGVSAALKDGTPTSSSKFRLRSTLLVLQVAAVVILLCGAGLLSRAIGHAASQDFGFDMEGLSVASHETPVRGYDTARVRAVAAQLAINLEAFDGTRVALSSTPPLGSGNIKGSFTVPGTTEEYFNAVYEVSPGYFALTGTKVLAGRALSAADTGVPRIVVNETLAKRFWTVDTAVGKHIVSTPPASGYNMPGELEIVGVVQDARLTSLTSVEPTIYQPLSGRAIPHILFRHGDREASGSAAAAAKRIDGRLRTRVQPLAENLEPRLRASRTAALAATALGGFALLLASVGLFGVFACWVQQRTHEIGIRMALGAAAFDVIGLVLRSSGVALAIGLLLGAMGTAASFRLLESYLFGLSPLDAVTYASVAAILVVAGGVATYIPARRAARIDPLQALRCE